MDIDYTKVPPASEVSSADPEPVAVEFLNADLPQHVRAFLDEQLASAKME
ncbi:hypothetical protein [Chitinasiproducens palmae]|uniref:Uncharacterized protein n=1 Tax=Chitinasiproducens palmae TaxID=1770053 RepID=A0A1H2PV31_9BURK|nr:hypothetical protein [Chitinasiproducens palmae]SDV51117.1 hypothetical protein SAMN05216551_11538 [Chitinasiproducens palmae]